MPPFDSPPPPTGTNINPSEVPQAVISRLTAILSWKDESETLEAASSQAAYRHDQWLEEEKRIVIPWMIWTAEQQCNTLNLAGWASLNHDTVSVLLERCGKTLQHLILPSLDTQSFGGPGWVKKREISPQIGPESAALIAETCPNLHTLEIHGWRGDDPVISPKSFPSLPSSLCILKFHCPIEKDDVITILSQCNSLEILECGTNYGSAMELWSEEEEQAMWNTVHSTSLVSLKLPPNLPITHLSSLGASFPCLKVLHVSMRLPSRDSPLLFDTPPRTEPVWRSEGISSDDVAGAPIWSVPLKEEQPVSSWHGLDHLTILYVEFCPSSAAAFNAALDEVVSAPCNVYVIVSYSCGLVDWSKETQKNAGRVHSVTLHLCDAPCNSCRQIRNTAYDEDSAVVHVLEDSYVS